MMIKKNYFNLFFIGFIFFKVIELFYGAIKIGFNIDEPYHHNQASEFINNGFYIDEESDNQAFTYGPVFGVISHLLNVLIGNSNFGEIEFDSPSYVTNHVAVALTSLSTVLLVMYVIFILTSNKTISLFSAAVLLSFPFWTGHSFHNVKDIPVAFGFTSFLVGNILFIALENKPINLRKFLSISILMILGTLMSAGNRPILYLYLLFLSLISFSYLFYKKYNYKLYFFIIFFSSITLLFFLPHFIYEPKESLTKTFFTSSSFPWQGTVLMRGEIFSPEATPAYFIVWFLAQTPLILLFLILFTFIYLIKLYSLQHIEGFTNKKIIYLLLYLQIFAIPLFVIINSSTVYHSLRHFLFIYPAISILIGLSVYLLIKNNIIKISRSKVTVFSIALIIPNLFAAQLFPYNSIFYNPLVAATSNIALEWETEAWGISGREVLQKTPIDGELNVWESVWDSDPFINERGINLSKQPEKHPDDFWGISSLASYIDGDSRVRALESGAIFESLRATCTLEHVVTRNLWNQKIPMAYLSRCQNSGNYINGFVSISWSTLSEIDSENKKFSWIGADGEIIRLSTLRDHPAEGELSFEVGANPCKFPATLKILIPNQKESFIDIPTTEEKRLVKLDLTLSPYSNLEVRVIPLDPIFCSVEGDQRDFVAKLSKINWIE